jgi:hypothetical protein
MKNIILNFLRPFVLQILKEQENKKVLKVVISDVPPTDPTSPPLPKNE